MPLLYHRRNGGRWLLYFIRVDLSQLTSIKPSSSFQTSSIHSACYTIFNKQEETASEPDKAQKGSHWKENLWKRAFKVLPKKMCPSPFLCYEHYMPLHFRKLSKISICNPCCRWEGGGADTKPRRDKQTLRTPMTTKLRKGTIYTEF